MKISKFYSEISPHYSLREGREIKRWTLLLPGAGCSYQKETGGCAMCGFGQSTQKYSRGKLLWSRLFKGMYLLAEKEVQAELPGELFIYNGGSFWNNQEIPESFQNYLYQQVRRHSSLGRLFIENRCEYINATKVYQARFALGDKRLTVGIGLESADDYVRNRLINKGLSRVRFEEKVKLIRRSGAEAAAYIFLKPPGLSEKEALADALASIRYVLALGVTEVHLSSAFVQTGTFMHREFLTGNFQPPSLWTILEVIREIEANNWPVLIGGFTDEPPPIAIPANCPDCSPVIYQAIEMYRRRRVLGPVPTCSCRSSLML